MTAEETKDELYRLLSDCVNGGYPLRNNAQRGRYRKAVGTAIRSLEAWDAVKAEIESNTESIIGKYDFTVSQHDRPNMKIARNEARQECLSIIAKHLQEVEK